MAEKATVAPKRQRNLATLFIFITLIQVSVAWQIVPSKRIPSYISASCSAALSQEIPATVCSPMANRLIKGYFYSEATLNRTCTDDCDEFLTQYEESVASSCNDETWDNYFNADETGEEPQSVPVRIIPNLTRYLFSLTCLKDNDRFCNVVIGTAAQLADPGSTLFGWAPLVNKETGIEAASSCDLCYIKRLRQEAGSPYYEGPRISSLGMYESLTSSCGVSNMPLTTSTLGFSTPTASATATPTCTGKTYTIQPEDDCYSVSKSQSIGTGWLLDDNYLGAWCSDFPTTGDLCITNTCDIYTVQNNDTCAGIARAANITEAQLRAWNPIINTGCYNLEKMNSTSLCISSPGKPYIQPTGLPVTGLPGAEATPVPVPSDKAENTTTRCAQYHDVVSGEYCNLLSLKYGISLEDFATLNPSINENCTNLYADESYCVKAVGDINTYPGRPGYTSTSSAGTVTTTAGPATAFTSLPDSTMTPYERNNTRSQLAERTRDDCATYFEGSIFSSVTLPAGSSLSSICALAAEVYFADLEVFGIWNPSINVSLPDCTFDSNRSYCGQLYWNANGLATKTEGSSLSYEIRAGYIESCTQFEDIPLGWICNDVFDYYGLTVEQFYEYNPAVGSDCNNLWPNYAYCVSIDPPNDSDEDVPLPTTTSVPVSTTSTVTSITTGPTPPAATQAGQPSTCNKWAVVGDGDGCWSLATNAGITLDQFYAWNPAVSSDCSSGLWPSYAYCVGVSSTSTTASTSTSSSRAPTTTTPAAPGQTQSGQAANCNKWDMAVSGDGCWAIANRNGINLADFYAWNTVLGTDGSACTTQIWPDYYYCIGVSA